LPRHAHSRDHRIQRKDNVQQDDLNDDADEVRREPVRDLRVFAFELVVNFMGALSNQEQAS